MAWRKIDAQDEEAAKLAQFLGADCVEKVDWPEYLGTIDDNVCQFLLSAIEVEPRNATNYITYHVPCGTLWSRYRTWCLRRQLFLVDKKTFLTSLKHIAPRAGMNELAKASYFYGVRLK